MPIPSIRIIVLTSLFVACAVFVYGVDRDGSTPIVKPLEEFPSEIGQWETINTQNMSEEIEDVLGVDDYVLRNYAAPNGNQVNLYVSYFAYTDRTKGYHSPLNCMPGSGWNIAKTEPVSLEMQNSGNIATVNKLILQNGRQKQASLYWYQCRGRILHNEYVERIYRVVDSLFKNRTDGAFIRLIATSSGQEIQQDAEMLKAFASDLIPVLSDFLPQ